MSKIAFISDIHGNMDALNLALEDIARRNIQKIICLGDVASYNAHANECMELIISNANITWIAGNHDLIAANLLQPLACNPVAFYASMHARKTLKNNNREHIRGLNLEYRNNDIHAFHASPTKVDEYLSTYPRLLNVIACNNNGSIKAKYIFFGHTHNCCVYHHINGDIKKHIEDKQILDHEGEYMINVGSLGEPRGIDKRGIYCIFDDLLKTIEIVRINYDHDKVHKSSLELKSRVYSRGALLFAILRRSKLKIRHKIFPLEKDNSNLKSLAQRMLHKAPISSG